MIDARKAMEQALAALEYHQEQTRPIQRTQDAIAALRTQLEAPDAQRNKQGSGKTVAQAYSEWEEIDNRNMLATLAAPQADAQDAARYRWLRAQRWNESTLAVVRFPKTSLRLGTDCPSDVRLDEFIDVAMQIEKDKP